MSAKKLGMAAGAACLLASVAVFAGSVQQNFTVNLKITPQCVAGAGTNITFQDSGYLAANVDAAGSIKVGCTKGTQPTITLNNGSNSANCPGGAARCMKSATTGEYVNYNLYTDSTRLDSWDSTENVTGPAGDGAVASGAGVANKTVDIFGRVPPQTTPPPAADYTDTVTATVSF